MQVNGVDQLLLRKYAVFYMLSHFFKKNSHSISKLQAS